MNFVPLKTPVNSRFSKFQIEYFYVFSPAFLSKRFCKLKTGGNIRRCTQAVEGSALEIRVDASPHFSISHEETSDFDVLAGFLTCLNDAFSNNILAVSFFGIKMRLHYDL